MTNPQTTTSAPSEDIATADTMQLIVERLVFMQMTPDSSAAIRSLKTIVDRELPVALDRFYEQVRKTPETMAFFRSEDHIGQAKGTQTGHWVNIANGDFGGSYGEKVGTIGTVHARIGLEPKWYIGGYAIVLDHLINAAVEEIFPQSGGWFAAKPAMTPADFGKALGALAKAVLLDMDMAISVYLEEAERAKQVAQAEAIAAEQKTVSESFGKAIASIAAQDLTSQVAGDLPEAYHSLRDDLNGSVETLRAALQMVGDNAAAIDAAVAEISHATADLSRRTEQQAASVEETAAALEQITATVSETAKRAEDAGVLVSRSRVSAEQSETIVQNAISTMGEIERSSREIGNITEMMDEIAFQTNLLALNAGVEAARAGDAGKGFAVVAQEVRVLAQRAADAAKEIKTLITTSGEKVKSGVSLVGETGAALQTIVSDVEEINQHVAAIVDASREQATGLREVNSAVTSIDQGTQQNAAMVEETTAANQHLASQAAQLKQLLGRFRLGQEPSSARQLSPQQQPPAQPRRPAARFVSHGSAAVAVAVPDRDAWEQF